MPRDDRTNGPEDSPRHAGTAPDTLLPPAAPQLDKGPVSGRTAAFLRNSRRARRRPTGTTRRIPRPPDYPAMLQCHVAENPDFSVLIVDDCRLTRLLVRSILIACGVREFSDAADGADALALIGKAVPDLIISDVEMTPLDGIELSRLIRKNPRSPDRNLPIVIMTGHTERNRIVELRAAGLTEVVAKPLSPSVLCRSIVTALRNNNININPVPMANSAHNIQ
jgi:two-component system chemotaxis response regulator CheY